MSTDQPADEPETMPSSKRRRVDPTNTRPGLLFLARLAGSCRRYEHMYHYMRSLVQLITPDQPLTSEERNCFATACCSHVKRRQDAYNFIAQAAADPRRTDQRQREAAMDYLSLISLEIHVACMDIVRTIDLHLLPQTDGPPVSADDLVLYKLLKGNFLMCVADVKGGMEKHTYTTAAIECFESAMVDGKDLPSSSSAGLSLQYSRAVLYSSAYGQPHKGYKIAQEAFNSARLELEVLEERPAEEAARALKTLLHFLDARKMYAS
ncbi:14-3-3-like protein D [Phalaenopsis equestris]|uniref:14-3-3-like protein D n=1 Tax=Phalaenopsis equestris TaxID=78828 RepID=UPI0009E2E868|nr:14-3-3-like protein D [Phalaenopsis equestris]